MKVARPVLNGEDEETGRKALRLVLTQLPRARFQPQLTPGVRLPYHTGKLPMRTELRILEEGQPRCSHINRIEHLRMYDV
jgi:hypothetical protein